MEATTTTADSLLSIGEVAERAGLRTSAIRFYERRGLLPAPERASGRRRYERGVLDLLSIIRVAKDAGFSLRETEELLGGFDTSTAATAATAPSERWRRLAQSKLSELDDLAARIEGMRSVLRRGLACECLRVQDCELLEDRRPAADR